MISTGFEFSFWRPASTYTVKKIFAPFALSCTSFVFFCLFACFFYNIFAFEYGHIKYHSLPFKFKCFLIFCKNIAIEHSLFNTDAKELHLLIFKHIQKFCKTFVICYKWKSSKNYFLNLSFGQHLCIFLWIHDSYPHWTLPGSARIIWLMISKAFTSTFY